MNKHLIGAAAALLVPWSSAIAADLGGNCCADLEERVAELEATTARKGNRKMSLEVSGHVNAALFTSDIDAANLDRVRILDNSNSESRFRFKGEAFASTQWSAGFLMEIGIGGDIDVRHSAVFLKLKELGTVWLGKTSEATDGITEISLAPSDASTLTSLAPLDAVIEDETNLGIVNPFDGSRTNTLTFRSASIAGFSAAASWNEGENWSAALRYAAEFSGFRLAAGAGYRDEDVCVGVKPCFDIGRRQFWGGSISAMLVEPGLFIDGAYANSDGWQVIRFAGVELPIGDGELELYAGRAGFSKAFSAVGKTTVYGEFGQLKIEGMDIDPRFYGLGASQDIAGAAASIYMSWRRYDLDISDVDDVNTFIGGVKVRF